MTNGEMIQKVFNCEVCEPIPEDDIIHVIFSDKNDSAIGFDWSWWNMEYKEPVTKNDLAHNLCDSCTNIGCEFQSGIVRSKCAFYMPPHIEPDNCGAKMESEAEE